MNFHTHLAVQLWHKVVEIMLRHGVCNTVSTCGIVSVFSAVESDLSIAYNACL